MRNVQRGLRIHAYACSGRHYGVFYSGNLGLESTRVYVTAMEPVQVLIVDDEKDFATAIVARLARRGFSAAAAFSGLQALKAVKEIEYDAVVLDLKMPGMNGLETLQAIRQIDPDMQTIILTGHGTVDAGIGGMQLGAADFLRKPVTIEKLCSAIEAAAERSRADRSLKNMQDTKKAGENL
jgi:DNA-binding NtrC family response regulator